MNQFTRLRERAHTRAHTHTYTQVLPWEYMVTRKLVGEEIKVSLLRKQALILIIKTHIQKPENSS